MKSFVKYMRHCFFIVLPIWVDKIWEVKKIQMVLCIEYFLSLFKSLLVFISVLQPFPEFPSWTPPFVLSVYFYPVHLFITLPLTYRKKLFFQWGSFRVILSFLDEQWPITVFFSLSGRSPHLYAHRERESWAFV